MEVRFSPTRWLGMDKDRGWWTLRNRGAIAGKCRGQRHGMTETDKKMDCVQRCDITEAQVENFRSFLIKSYLWLCSEATGARPDEAIK